MANMNPDKLRELFPEPWWSGYRAGRAEAIADRATRRQIVEEELKSSIANPKASSSLDPAAPRLSADPASGVQAEINRQLGLDEATFQTYAHH